MAPASPTGKIQPLGLRGVLQLRERNLIIGERRLVWHIRCRIRASYGVFGMPFSIPDLKTHGNRGVSQRAKRPRGGLRGPPPNARPVVRSPPSGRCCYAGSACGPSPPNARSRSTQAQIGAVRNTSNASTESPVLTYAANTLISDDPREVVSNT